MNLIVAVLAVSVVGGAYLLATAYVRRSMRSYQSASRLWTDIIAAAREITESDIGEPASRFVVGLIAAAGCGCFVRGMLAIHYLGGNPFRRSHASEWDKSFDAINELAQPQKAKLDRLVMMVIIYDSFRNPAQGWLFRRVLRSYVESKPTPMERVEAQLTAFSALSGRQMALAA